MFDWILSVTVSEVKVSRTGVTRPNSADSHQTQIQKRWNLGLTRRPHFLQGELIHLVEKAKNAWLIVGQWPIKAGWWNAPLVLRDFSRSNKHEDSHEESPWFSAFPTFPEFPHPFSAFPPWFPAFPPWLLALPPWFPASPSFPSFRSPIPIPAFTESLFYMLPTSKFFFQIPVDILFSVIAYLINFMQKISRITDHWMYG